VHLKLPPVGLDKRPKSLLVAVAGARQSELVHGTILASLASSSGVEASARQEPNRTRNSSLSCVVPRASPLSRPGDWRVAVAGQRLSQGGVRCLSPHPVLVRLGDDESHTDRRRNMKYALLIYSKPGSHEALPEDEYNAVFAEYTALVNDSRCVTSAQLQPVETATTVHVQDGKTLTTDGPFANTKEVFGGYYVFEANGLDEAIELAARIPAARLGGSVEVRPVVER
jgi:hypothetical protein